MASHPKIWVKFGFLSLYVGVVHTKCTRHSANQFIIDLVLRVSCLNIFLWDTCVTFFQDDDDCEGLLRRHIGLVQSVNDFSSVIIDLVSRARQIDDEQVTDRKRG